MVEIKEISYKDERIGFFANQRKLVQKRYDRLEKAIKPDEPYMSERRQFLSDCGRELSFYNDVIEMLESERTVPNAIIYYLFENLADAAHYAEDGKIIVDYDDVIKIRNDVLNKLKM